MRIKNIIGIKFGVWKRKVWDMEEKKSFTHGEVVRLLELVKGDLLNKLSSPETGAKVK